MDDNIPDEGAAVQKTWKVRESFIIYHLNLIYPNGLMINKFS